MKWTPDEVRAITRSVNAFAASEDMSEYWRWHWSYIQKAINDAIDYMAFHSRFDDTELAQCFRDLDAAMYSFPIIDGYIDPKSRYCPDIRKIIRAIEGNALAYSLLMADANALFIRYLNEALMRRDYSKDCARDIAVLLTLAPSATRPLKKWEKEWQHLREQGDRSALEELVIELVECHFSNNNIYGRSGGVDAWDLPPGIRQLLELAPGEKKNLPDVAKGTHDTKIPDTLPILDLPANDDAWRLAALYDRSERGYHWSLGYFHALQMREKPFRIDNFVAQFEGGGLESGKLNALTYAIQNVGGSWAVENLQMLKREIPDKLYRDLVDRVITRMAETEGLSADEYLDRELDDFDLGDNACIEEEAGSHILRVALLPGKKPSVKAFDKSGNPLKGVPASIKTDHKEIYSRLNGIARKLAAQLTVFRARVERQYYRNTQISADHFRNFYLRHPIAAFFARRLIWTDDRGRTFLGSDGIADDAADVRLWHPALATPQEIAAWRRRVMDDEVIQPFKQAFRELYVITPAEMETRIYSNRFAGTIVQNALYHALRASRGWGGDFGGPRSELVGRQNHVDLSSNLRGRVWFDLIGDQPAPDIMMVEAQHLSVDQVRFESRNGRTWEAVPLENVDPVGFSEVMRDVDLFVTVAGVAHDPGWADAGPADRDGVIRQYPADMNDRWSEAAATRAELLREVISKMGLQCVEIRDRTAVVQGKLNQYSINLASGHIYLEPHKQYLCIVPKRGTGMKKVFLPFEETDHMTMEILSKILYLLADDKISDPTVTSQLRNSGSESA